MWLSDIPKYRENTASLTVTRIPGCWWTLKKKKKKGTGLVILTAADTTDEQFFLYYFIVHFESTWRKHGEFVTYNAVLQQHTGQNADVCIHLCLGRLLSGEAGPCIFTYVENITLCCYRALVEIQKCWILHFPVMKVNRSLHSPAWLIVNTLWLHVPDCGMGRLGGYFVLNFRLSSRYWDYSCWFYLAYSLRQ